jgi:hypothetical protein
MASRRQFIRWSMASVSALTVGAVSLQWLQQEDWALLESSSSQAWTFLTEEDRLLLTCIAPAMLGSTYLSHWQRHHSLSELLLAIDQAIVHLSLSTQQELRQLFDLLWNRLGKLLLAGIWASWSEASPRVVTAFLNHWRNSWLASLNQGYLGLQQLFMAALYADPQSWSLCHYPGPPF